jgi:hypothetical protein
MATKTEMCVALHNRPGTLAKLCGLLRRAKVNIDAVSVSENAECNWVRLVATPSASAKRVLTKAGYHFTAQRVLAARAQNRPGELERFAAALGKAGVNINYVYGSNSAAHAAAGSTLIFSVNDLRKAAKTLKA